MSRLDKHWKPKPIEPPAPDPELKHLNGIQRAAEVVRYSVLALEWWLSPNGRLREWLKLNGKVSSILIIPAVLVVPLITFIIWQITKWTGWLVTIAGNIITLIAVGVILGVIILLRVILGR